ncbi:DnaT-like ssDNA-binding protein [Chromobacterium haemolyticum]|uniref:DnaT-like ssDNA-binding protein n=1 Tax=Chromobacterium haemolyticum TaxID=394935 RepID=UPI0013195A41|nr:DnaT-like ssDNA-binding protein [Chromobacterium haemolyticum]BBH12906.1 hypothetical protein CH06BL_21540 [Chromobacterium haemolyticum]
MALIVEDGSGLANAESLVSLDEADDYHLEHGNGAWGGMSIAMKERHLRYAALYLSSMWQFAGKPIKVQQGLAFPRTPAGLPARVKTAQMELALVDDLAESLARVERGMVTRKQTESLVTDYAQPIINRTAAARFPLVNAMLKPYLAAAGHIKLIRG